LGTVSDPEVQAVVPVVPEVRWVAAPVAAPVAYIPSAYRDVDVAEKVAVIVLPDTSPEGASAHASASWPEPLVTVESTVQVSAGELLRLTVVEPNQPTATHILPSAGTDALVVMTLVVALAADGVAVPIVTGLEMATG
jgi:hypothetical protein